MKNPHIESLKRLEHIQQAILDIEKFVRGENLETFNDDKMLQDAVLMKFIIMGEAINHVEIEKLERYEYPWYKVRSFRNMIAHEYFNIKISAVWLIIVNDLPDLKKVVNEMLKNEF